MDETEQKNNNDRIILKEELDININDLFTIDFKNLKIFLTTILQNQNKISQKMDFIETSINDKQKKNDKNISLLNKKIKVIENNFSASSAKLENLKKGLDDIEKFREQEEPDTDKEKNKEENKYMISNLNMEIKDSKKNEIKSNDNANDNIEKEKENEIDNNKEKEKEKEKEEEKEKEDIIDDEDEKEIKDEIINKNNIKKQSSYKKYKPTEKENKEINNTITEEESSNKSERKENLETQTKEINEPSTNINERKYDDPYRNFSTIKFNNYNLEEVMTKFPNLLDEVEEMKSKINLIERKMKATERGSKLIAFASSDENPTEEIQYLKLLIKDLQNKNTDLEKERDAIKKDIEDMKIKLQDLNIFEVFKGDGIDQGSIDMAKALIMTLEQKVFKKTGLIDEKIKHLEESMNKLETDNKNMKNLSEILKLSNEDIKRMLKNLEEIENKNAEDNLSLINDVNDIMNNIKKLKEFETKANDNLNNNNTIIEKMQNSLTKVTKQIKEINEILEDYEPQKPGIEKSQFLKFKNEVNESIKDLKRKNNDMEKEIDYLKKHPDLIKAKNDILKLEKEIGVKVNKTDYLDLKDKVSMMSVDVTNLNDSIDKIQEMTTKTKNEISFFLKRLESLSAAQVSTRSALNDLIKKQQELLFDTNKYLELTAFDKFLSSYQKEKENNENEMLSINKLLKEMAEALKSKSGAEDMKLFEQLINNKLEELKLYSIRKLADKVETTRNIKYLDSQIRHIIDVYIKKADKSESWLIAKKPLGGYSCASCESYLGELKNTKEFTPWSKYPNREDKNYRYGSGFSRMLNMLNVDFKNQLDAIKDNAYESDNEGRNSAEPKSVHNRRFSKNLSSANVNSTHMNSRNNINTSNKSEVFPKIITNKGNENSNNIGYSSIDLLDNTNEGKTNESNGLYNDNDKNRENMDEPHVIKIYRKNKFKSIEVSNKKS